MAKWENAGGCINILENLQYVDIPALAAETPLNLIQFQGFTSPNNHTWDVLNEFFGLFPEVGLRLVWNHDLDFDFYERLPNLRNIKLACYYTTDFDMLLTNTNLQHLTIEETRSRKIDFSFIGEFPALRSLYLEGDKRGIENIAALNTLEKLTLRGLKSFNLGFIAQLRNLKTLRLLLGSYLNIHQIGLLPNLRHLELSRVRQIDDYSFIEMLSKLEKLKIDRITDLKELPDLSHSVNLTELQLLSNSRLKKYRQIVTIPNLEKFQFVFPHNVRINARSMLANQIVNLILKNKTIRYTNITDYTSDATTRHLLKLGIEYWNGVLDTY